jgi:putative restriction endonuclease
MPAIRPAALVKALIEAVYESDATAFLRSTPREHPRVFVIETPSGSFELWSYAWTLTHGGRPSLPDEYRIQMTSVASPLPLNPFGPTVLVGYEPNLKMFAGFDLARHKTFTQGSPSVQVDIRALQTALRDGMAFDRKTNKEIAVAFRPDQFLNYAFNSKDLHKYGKSTTTFDLLQKASSLQEIEETDLATLPVDRRRVVSTVSKLSRVANFRRKVTDAYAHRCAVTRMQLRLIDAAHIIPVGAPGSSDEVVNGLALSPTYHRAFDRCLIFLDESFIMRPNDNAVAELVTLGLDGGLADFKRYLGKPIHLPADRRQWPSKKLIRVANEARQVG